MPTYCETCNAEVDEPREWNKEKKKWECRDCYPTAFAYFYNPKIHQDPIEQIGFQKFRKKQIIIKAKQMPRPFMVDTLEGMMTGKASDYLIIGIHNETYPINKDIFEKTYEYFCICCKSWHDANHLNENHPASFDIK